MRSDVLAQLREQAERSILDVKAAALLRLARVEFASDPASALHTFEAGLEAATQTTGTDGKWLLGRARLIAAAIAPERIPQIPGDYFPQEPDELVRTMLDHGRHEAARLFALNYKHRSDFPFFMVEILLRSTSDEKTRSSLMQRAAQAWREDAAARLFNQESFLGLLQKHWMLLPRAEARAIALEIVEHARSQPDTRILATFNEDDTLKITSSRTFQLFRVLHILRALEPQIVERLLGEDGDLAAIASRFPNGMETVMEEANARSLRTLASAAQIQGVASGGYRMMGSRGELPYLDSRMGASRDANFEPPLEHAFEKLQRDQSPESPNLALVEFWPSTSAFRRVLYGAGKSMGASATAYLDRVPEGPLRLFAAIELEAALAGLPELKATVKERRMPTPEHATDEGVCGPHIRCPKCEWQPRKSSKWACQCGHWWNTFDTGGVCPGCMHQWKDTQCLQCVQWSPHSDWYGQL